MAAFSVTGSLLLPLRLETPPVFALDGVAFTAKSEHHLTVLGSTRGGLLLAAAAVDPALRERAEALATSFDFSVALADDWVRLVEREDGVRLETIIVLATAPVAEFFAALRALVSAEAAAGSELAASLAAPPPPHVTVFTTDPAGKRGIGLASQAELDTALAAPPNATLRARELAPREAPRGVIYLPK
jgi:hypothetical protein